MTNAIIVTEEKRVIAGCFDQGTSLLSLSVDSSWTPLLESELHVRNAVPSSTCGYFCHLARPGSLFHQIFHGLKNFDGDCGTIWKT
jgi:hypothetical protein